MYEDRVKKLRAFVVASRASDSDDCEEVLNFIRLLDKRDRDTILTMVLLGIASDKEDE